MYIVESRNIIPEFPIYTTITYLILVLMHKWDSVYLLPIYLASWMLAAFILCFIIKCVIVLADYAVKSYTDSSTWKTDCCHRK